MTVALFTALVEEGRCHSQPDGTRVRIHTSAGELDVLLYGEANGLTVEMGQRLPYFEAPAAEVIGIEEMLGRVPLHMSFPVEIVSTGLRHLMVPFGSAENLAELKPDFSALARLSRGLRIDTVCAFICPAQAGGRVRMRDFCPGIGANEESASGTTSGALACYLVKHGIVAPNAWGDVNVFIEQGVEMGRSSLIEAKLVLSDDGIQRVCVRGRAVRTLTGELALASVPLSLEETKKPGRFR